MEEKQTKATAKKSSGSLLKKRRQRNNWIRFIIQLCFLIVFPSAFTAAFAGAKYMLTQIGARSMVELSSFVLILLGLCAYTFAFGRFFCGYACAFGSFGDWVHTGFAFLWNKIFHKKLPGIPLGLGRLLNYVKYLILLMILGLCYQGIYGNYQGTSPWDVFSRLESLLPGVDLHGQEGLAVSIGAWKAGMLSGYMIGGILLILIILGMCFQERFFCRFLCPMGAIFSLLPVLPFSNLRRNRETCSAKCSLCEKACPAGIPLPEADKPEVLGDCFQCQMCTDLCPKQNIKSGIPVMGSSHMALTICKALILAGLMYWLNI